MNHPHKAPRSLQPQAKAHHHGMLLKYTTHATAAAPRLEGGHGCGSRMDHVIICFPASLRHML